MDILGKVLVVDSTTQSTDLISRWLVIEDLVVYTAESGLNALAKIQLFKPDLVITNTELPDMSGFELCKRIKTHAESRYVLVLCMSSLGDEWTRMRAMEVGADDYMDISAEHYVFLSKVKSLLRVKQLSNQLRQQYAELEEKNIILDRQLQMGMQMQRALIPDIDMRVRDCRLLSRYYPAIGVGGDFYNVLQLSEHSFGIVMGDVSGHGIAAAFVTAILNMMIKNLTPKYYNPDQLLFYLNNEFSALFEKTTLFEIYACIFYAVVDTKEQCLRYANAGQSLPLYVDVVQNKARELEVFGVPIGMINNTHYEMKSLYYNREDLLLLHTDGLQDVYYKEQPDEFTQRIKEMMLELRFVSSMSEILDVICDNFYNTAASESERMEMDDASMILCRL